MSRWAMEFPQSIICLMNGATDNPGKRVAKVLTCVRMCVCGCEGLEGLKDPCSPSGIGGRCRPVACPFYAGNLGPVEDGA